MAGFSLYSKGPWYVVPSVCTAGLGKVLGQGTRGPLYFYMETSPSLFPLLPLPPFLWRVFSIWKSCSFRGNLKDW